MALSNDKMANSERIIASIGNELDARDADANINSINKEEEYKIKRLREENKKLKETIVELAIELYGDKNKN